MTFPPLPPIPQQFEFEKSNNNPTIIFATREGELFISRNGEDYKPYDLPPFLHKRLLIEIHFFSLINLFDIPAAYDHPQI